MIHKWLLFYFILPVRVVRKAFFLYCYFPFFIYYLIYIFVPVAGPQYYFPAIGLKIMFLKDIFAIGDYFNYHQELLPGPGYMSMGLLYNLVEGSQQSRRTAYGCFPSSHVGISTILEAGQ